MRILILVNRDLPSSLALNLLIPRIRHHELTIRLTERVGGKQAAVDEPVQRRELISAEQRLPNELFFPVIEQAQLPDSRGRHLTFLEIERLWGIAVKPLADPNTTAAIETLRGFAPDLILTIRYGAILKPPVIQIARSGVLNLHSGLLPAYRGVLATFRALMNGDKEIGCTLHWISDGSIDTGDVIGVRTIAVDPARSLLAHILALYPVGIDMVSSTIEEIASGRRPAGSSQADERGRYYTYPTQDEWALFERRGWRIADTTDLHGALQHYSGAKVGAG